MLSAVRRDDEEDMLPLTLYREMVMWWQEGQGDAMQSMCWKKVKGALLGGIRGRQMGEMRKQFEKDRKRFSWWEGTDKVIAEARKRCEAVPHLMDVVSGLMQIDWRLRMTYEELLKSPLFDILRTEDHIPNDGVYTVDVEALKRILESPL